MRNVGRIGLSLALAMLSGPADAEPAHGLADGLYEVSVRLDLPNLIDGGAAGVAVVCISATAAGGSHGLAVLSDNNPLSHCPVVNVRRDGMALAFDIVCPGGNAASGRAVFEMRRDRFDGRIAMKMGGKNMTMTETQSGHRVGDCPAVARSPS